MLSIAGAFATAWFAWELLGDERVALLACALVVASPFAWVQGASLLGYQLSFVLGAATTAALLRAIRCRSTAAGLAGGALLGLGVLHRPFDALLASIPVLGYLAWSVLRRRELQRVAATVVVGGVPFAAMFLVYNARVMGSVSRLAYSVTGPSDTFGFGWRSSFSVAGEDRNLQLHYTVGRAFSSLQHLSVSLPRFIAFAPVVLVLAAVCVWIHRTDARVVLLAAMVLIVMFGYFFWWGVANSYQYKLDLSLGPFYYYPLLAPLCVLAAWGAVSVRRSAAGLVAAAVVGLGWAGIASAVVMIDAHHAGGLRASQVAALSPPVAPSTSDLVLEFPVFPNDPYLRLANDAALRAKRLVAVDVAGRRFEILDRFPQRTPYLVRSYRPFNQLFGALYSDRVRLHVLRSAEITAHVHITLPEGQAGAAYVQIGNRAATMSASGRGTFDSTLTIDPTSVTAETPITIGVATVPIGSRTPTTIAGETLACSVEARATANHQLEILEPCDGLHHYAFPNGTHAIAAEDVSPRLHVTFTAT